MSMGGGGSGGAVANLFIRLRADTSQGVAGLRSFRQEMKQVDNRTVQTGQAMSAAGRKMTMGLTVPLVAIGAKAVQSAVQFDNAFAKIEALVGVSADEVERMRDRTLELSGETAQAPQDLADAMFFITSAGLDGAAATDVLEASAKAAAVGLGDTATVADLATSAMNAYGVENLTATEAVDTLTAAVRLGKLEPDEMASALGRVIPIASAMGIEFDELGAAMAAMSRTGTNAREAATQIRSIMTQLLNPTTDAAEALESVGLSSEEVQRKLRDDGLLDTLLDLKERFGGNTTALSAVFGNVRALSGVMDMLGSNVEETEAIFADMEDTSGELDQAFEKISSTSGFQMEQAMADIQTSMLALGEVLLPIVSSIVSHVGSMVGAFTDLPGPVQTAIAVFGGLVAAAGPVLMIVGSMVKNWGMLMGAMEARGMMGAQRALRGIARGMGMAAGAAAGAVAVWATWNAVMESSREAGRDWAQSVNDDVIAAAADGEIGMEGFEAKLLAMEDGVNHLSSEVANSKAPWDKDKREEMKAGRDALKDAALAGLEVRDAVKAISGATGDSEDDVLRWVTAQVQAGEAFEGAEDALRKYNQAQLEASGLDAEAAEATAGLGQGFVDLESDIGDAEDALKSWQDSLRAQFDPLFAMQDALHGVEDARHAVAEAEAAAAAAAEEHGAGSAEHAAAIRDVEAAMLGQGRAALDVTTASTELKQAMANGTVTMEGSMEMLDGWVDQGLLTRDEAALIALSFQDLEGRADELGSSDPTLIVDADGKRAEDVLEAAEGRAANWHALWVTATADADANPANNAIATVEGRANLWGARVDTATVAADNQPASWSLDWIVGRATGWASGNYTATVDADTSKAESKFWSLQGIVQRYLDLARQVPTAPAATPVAANIPGRRTGGSVFPGRVYEVNEDPGPGELLHSGGRQYLLAGQQGEVVPLSPLAQMTADSAGALGSVAAAAAPGAPMPVRGTDGASGDPTDYARMRSVMEKAFETALRRSGAGHLSIDGENMARVLGPHLHDDVR